MTRAGANSDTASENQPLLSEVTLERFKAAFRPDPVPLQAFNVVIGRNGSGKSTLLEALQWLDATIRRDAREASDRYYGAKDLMNLRSQVAKPYFRLSLVSDLVRGQIPQRWRYVVKVGDIDGVPQIEEEKLDLLKDSGRVDRSFIETRSDGRWVLPDGTRDSPAAFPIRESDRLAIARAAEATTQDDEHSPSFLASFWKRAVFLRLSPNRIASGSPATRRSFEPILDEEGQTLPALLNELTVEQRKALVGSVQEALPGIRDVDILKSAPGRDARVHYGLREEMPFQGRAGRSEFSIPAWMLSEGTRRITAILTLLVREPHPSLLCIEEVENGLDPWTVKILLNHLRSAADRGVQVVLTTHSPWLLDHVPMSSIIQVRRLGGDTRYERFADRPEIKAYDSSVPAGTRYVNEAE